MARSDHPYAHVGRPAVKVVAKWAIIDEGRKANFNIGLIQRTRTSASMSSAEVSYAVVRSKEPILANGTKLRPLEAVAFGSAGFTRNNDCKASRANAWHSSLPEAKSKFASIVGKRGLTSRDLKTSAH